MRCWKPDELTVELSLKFAVGAGLFAPGSLWYWRRLCVYTGGHSRQYYSRRRRHYEHCKQVVLKNIVLLAVRNCFCFSKWARNCSHLRLLFSSTFFCMCTQLKVRSISWPSLSRGQTQGRPRLQSLSPMRVAPYTLTSWPPPLLANFNEPSI